MTNIIFVLSCLRQWFNLAKDRVNIISDGKHVHKSTFIIFAKRMKYNDPINKNLRFLYLCCEPLLGQTVSTLTEAIPGGAGVVCVDKTGNIYVADFGNKLGRDTSPETKVYKVTPEGTESVFAIRLFGASGNAINPQGNIFQSNIGANRTSKITHDGTVTTFWVRKSGYWCMSFKFPGLNRSLGMGKMV